MSCQHLNEVTLENLISKASYPVFRCEECIQIMGVRELKLRITLNFRTRRRRVTTLQPDDIRCL